MKLTLGWLKDYLETDKTLDEIVVGLTALGLEVDGVEDRAALYAPFFVARVEAAEKHPDADRLQVLSVDTGREKMQVVCGAPNARAGMKGIFAPEGSLIPGTGTVLKNGNIRGVDSCGMMVSEREMGLSDAHEGIIEVADDVAIGTPFATLYRLDDPVIEIGLTPNRADCAGIYGIARDLAAAGFGTLKHPNAAPVAGTFDNPVSIDLQTPDCPLFIGRMMRGVKNGPSPEWLADRLRAVGQKPISALVDITNYMTIALNRPLHVFDADKLKGNLHVRAAREGESFLALNGKDYALKPGMVVVCDDSGVLALGGVIGGESTAVDENTQNVYIEAAYFDPPRTARTGRDAQIDSDARYRFERGIDPAFTAPGMDIATALIQTICGGEASHSLTAGAVPPARAPLSFDPAFVKKLSGVDLDTAAQAKILTALGFTATPDGAHLSVQVPTWRPDIEGAPDLVEEIVRVYGYDKLPICSVTKMAAITQNAETPGVARARRARTVLAMRGMDECVTWSFMDKNLALHFSTADTAQQAALTIANPISSELNYMRPSILPNLIAAAGRNHDRGYPGSALCEVGPVFTSPKIDGQRSCAAGVRMGAIGPRHWSGPAAARAVDVFDAKADVLAVLESCGLPPGSGQVGRDAPGWYHPGRSGTIRLGRDIVAAFGEIHPAILADMKIDGPVAAFEVFLDSIPAPRAKGTARPLLSLSAFQPLSRDFAFIVDADTEADLIVRTARTADKAMIAAVDLFDVYQGKGIDPRKKSVAIAVTLQPQDKTLTDQDIDGISKKIVDAVTSKTGGVLRG